MPTDRKNQAAGVVDRVGKGCECEPWQYYENSATGTGLQKRKTAHQRREQAAKWFINEAAKEQRYDKNGYLKTHRICSCGNTMYGKAAADIKRTQHGISEKGLRYCENVAICPVCAGLILRERAVEIDQGMKSLLDRDGSALMLTLTISHTKKDKLKDLLDLLQGAWSKLIKDKMHGIEEDHHILGRIKRLEVTLGENGWHPHLHVLLPARFRISDRQAAAIEDEIFALWSKEVEKLGGSVNRAHGVDVSVARNLEAVGNYISKELTALGDTKTSNGSMNPFQLLDKDTQENKRLYMEYVKAMKSKHVLGWSQGLKDKLGIVDKTDSEILQEINEDQPGEETMARIEAKLYNQTRTDRQMIEAVKTALEAEDYYFAAAILGCSYYMTPIHEDGELKFVPYFYRTNEKQKPKVKLTL